MYSQGKAILQAEKASQTIASSLTKTLDIQTLEKAKVIDAVAKAIEPYIPSRESISALTNEVAELKTEISSLRMQVEAKNSNLPLEKATLERLNSLLDSAQAMI